jgi:hypothetical protein
MAVRYSQELTNIAGEEYRVDIIDDDYVGSASEFILVDFEVDWKGQQNDRSNFITGSSCSIIVKSIPSSNLDTLVADIIAESDERFNLAIYKKKSGTYQLWWAGFILTDLSGGTDEYATTYTISATDGIASLKEQEFSAGSNPKSSLTAVDTILEALGYLPYNSVYADTDVILNTRVNWFEANMSTTSDDPLALTLIPNTTFYEVDNNGNYTFKSCYDVVNTICNLFKARFFYADGIWRFYQIYDLENESSFAQYRYQLDKTQVTGTQSITIRQTLTGGFSGGVRLATHNFEFLPALHKVTQVFKHDSSGNMLQGFVLNQSTPLTNLGVQLENNNNQTLALSGTLQTILQDTTGAPYTATVVYVKVRLTMQVNLSSPYYLSRPINNQVQNNDYTTLAWQSSTPAYVEYITVQNVNQFGGISIPINFETPVLPTSGFFQIQLQIQYVQDLQGNNIAGNYTTQAILQNPYLEYIEGGSENERTYTTSTGTNVTFADDLEFDELNVGDRLNSTTLNALQVYDGSDYVDTTADWGRNTLTGTEAIITVGIKEFTAGQRLAVRRRQGDFVGTFEIYKVLGVASEYYLFLGVRYAAYDAKYSGEWYKVGQYNSTGLTVQEIGKPLSVQYQPDAPSVGQVPGLVDPLPTNVEMYDGKVEIIENSSGVRKVVLDANTYNYLIKQVAIGTDTPDSTSILTLSSTTQGFLLPRMTTAQMEAISSPTEGLMVYNTTQNAVYYHNGTTWHKP